MIPVEMYRACNGRVALDVTGFQRAGVAPELLWESLEGLGCRLVDVDIVRLARAQVGQAHYRRGARLTQAPEVVDCSSFVKWIFAERGIWLPRRTVQQMRCGQEVMPYYVCDGDLIYTEGRHNWYAEDLRVRVGHVGIMTADKTVIHATNNGTNGAVEVRLREFLAKGTLVTIRRLLPAGHRLVTVTLPPGREVETSDDLLWMIRERQPWPKDFSE